MLVKTSDLIGPALDWAVGIAEGNPMERPASDVVWSKYHGAYNPSTNWSQGGPLIEKHTIGVDLERDGLWVATPPNWTAETIRYAPTPLIAACRAIVAAKLGDQIDVPDELMQS